MGHVDDYTIYGAIGFILQLRYSHPREICATYNFLVATVEVAVVALDEILVPLEEIHHLVTELWCKEVVDRAGFGFLEMSLRDVFSDAVNFFGSELLERLLSVLLANHMVVGISAK